MIAAFAGLAIGAALLPGVDVDADALTPEPLPDPPVQLAQEIRDLNAILRGLAPLAEPQRIGGALPAVDLDVRFAIGAADLTAEAVAQIDILAEALQSDALARQRVMIAGHTDATGAAITNLALSQRRANAVRDYLTEVHGIEIGRLVTVGFGEEHLKDPLQPNSGVNRRVEVRLLGEMPG